MGKLKRNKIKRIINPIGLANLRDVDYKETDLNCSKLTTGDVNSILEKVFLLFLYFSAIYYYYLSVEFHLKFYIRYLLLEQYCVFYGFINSLYQT